MKYFFYLSISLLFFFCQNKSVEIDQKIKAEQIELQQSICKENKTKLFHIWKKLNDSIPFKQYDKIFNQLISLKTSDSISIYYSNYKNQTNSIFDILNNLKRNYLSVDNDYCPILLLIENQEKMDVLVNKLNDQNLIRFKNLMFQNDILIRNFFSFWIEHQNYCGFDYQPFIFFNSKRYNHLDTVKGLFVMPFYWENPVDFKIKFKGRELKNHFFHLKIDTVTSYQFEVSYLNDNFKDTTFLIEHKIIIE